MKQPVSTSADNRATKPVTDEPPDDSPWVYGILGAGAGFFLGLRGVLIWDQTGGGEKGAWFLLLGVIFGVVGALELYSTRSWDRFGSHMTLVRWTIAGSSAASLTALGGVLLGLFGRNELPIYGLVGAVGGFFCGVRVLYDRKKEAAGEAHLPPILQGTNTKFRAAERLRARVGRRQARADREDRKSRDDQHDSGD